ncbi:uncharacterized protein LOC133445870 isoform X2 [Cololabis saira]|uniref:uncharacterized protein LOC133445870 isoform X2 n=1 Tax=Cololabis saira TaxID=129043 RepID=UPI002AD249E2|nr:uncharacterized protein LOC133445870 isoform X2 [Cololabis saira]
MGGIVGSSAYWAIGGTVMCCIFWTFLPAESSIVISTTAGSAVTLPCKNRPNATVRLLTWELNGDNVFTFRTKGKQLSKSAKALNLSLKMSTSENELYALTIERVQRSHAGNYTCRGTTVRGLFDQSWTLVVTEGPKHIIIIIIAAASGVPCLCLLIFLPAWIIKRRARRRRAMRVLQSAEREEPIYDNCLEIERHQNRHHKQRTH